MINYILQVILFQILFLAVYDFFLKKETFFKWNRLYLLLSPILALIIPLLKLESIQKSMPKEYVISLPEVILNPQVVIEQTTNTNFKVDYISIIFWIGVLIFTFLFLLKLTKIIRLIISNKVIKKGWYSLVILNHKRVAFSFFNYIFINEKLLKNNDLQIIQHELIHCKQKHTIDLLLFEILKIVQWFNPIIYQFQRRITTLHEYLSDDEIVKHTNAKTYFNKLLSETFNVENITFINQFYKQSLIKKRIAMITKNKSQKIKQLKYLLIAPLLLFMIIYSSCTNEPKTDIDEIETILQQKQTLTNGQYFKGHDGIILFTGNSLEGKQVPYEEMTNREKVFYNKFKSKNYEGIDIQVVIDKNKDRVIFIKTNRIYNNEKRAKLTTNNDISFSIVDQVPVYPGCRGDQTTLRKCLQENITQLVSNNFNANLSEDLKLSPGVKRVFVMFSIDKEGQVINIKARAPHKKLEEEAIRVIKLIPKMIPGKQDGKNVNVKYSLPIAFKVGDEKEVSTSNNLNSEKKPLYILEGLEISKEEMRKINPSTILKINVLKDESAIEKYGEKGNNGVVEITLKKE